MTKTSTFLLRFQEPCQPTEDASFGTATETRAREERDQDHHGWAGTAERLFVPQQPDQSDSLGDSNFLGEKCQISVSHLALGTRTETKAREENDQDRSNLSMGTKTATATREEDDADVCHSGHYVLPVVL